jgi:DNA-dependent RNA polymerase auxiliary subunit epsilon
MREAAKGLYMNCKKAKKLQRLLRDRRAYGHMVVYIKTSFLIR